MRWTAILCAALAAACAPKDEGLTVARLPDGTYRLTLQAGDLADEAQAQRLLLPAALQLCGKGEIAFGDHTFDRTSAPPRLVQDLKCGAPAVIQPAATRFIPTADDEAAVADLSERFLRARDAGDVAAASGFFPPGWPVAEQRAWSVEAKAFGRLAGVGTKQAITRISWFENPPAAPAPGLYVAVDYARAFQRVKTACGFIVWRRQEDGGWRIDREKLSYLASAQEARTPRSDLPQVRAGLGCR